MISPKLFKAKAIDISSFKQHLIEVNGSTFLNYLISFWYYIYSPKGTLNLKLNEKSIFLTSGFGQGVAVFPMKPGNNVIVSFEATLYPTSSIYLTNFKLIPKP